MKLFMWKWLLWNCFGTVLLLWLDNHCNHPPPPEQKPNCDPPDIREALSRSDLEISRGLRQKQKQESSPPTSLPQMSFALLRFCIVLIPGQSPLPIVLYVGGHSRRHCPCPCQHCHRDSKLYHFHGGPAVPTRCIFFPEQIDFYVHHVGGNSDHYLLGDTILL